MWLRALQSGPGEVVLIGIHQIRVRQRVKRVRDFMESEVAAHERVAGVVLHRPQEPRAARPSDILLIPEGHPEPLAFARAALGPARAILCVLAAPGLFGWSFDGSEPCEEPMRVDPGAVGRPEQLEAARHLGLELWTNARAIAAQARAHGIPHHYIGVGRPSPYPAAPAKSIDVVIVGLFAAAWLLAVVAWRYGRVEERLTGGRDGGLAVGDAAVPDG